jgi:RNA polymerase sigma-70 factor, ECF subfamily
VASPVVFMKVLSPVVGLPSPPLRVVREGECASAVAPTSPLLDRARTMFETHYAAIWRLLRRLGVQPSQLDDAAQEVFAVLVRKLADVEVGKEGPYLYGVALRVASNEVRRSKAHPTVQEIDALVDLADERPSPEAELARRRDRVLLDMALDRLPHDLRTVFVLAQLEELEVRQIAEIEGIPVGTASSRLRRAREEFSAIAKRLRAELDSVKGLSNDRRR